MKTRLITVHQALLILVVVGLAFATSCSWEIFDPLNQPTNTFSGAYRFENEWWQGKLTDAWYVDARGNQIYAWWMAKEPDSPVIMYFHGIGGNLGSYAAHIRFLYQDTPFSVFAIDYPASGLSLGNRSEQDLYASARGALQWVTDNTELLHDQIIAYGFSLGAALAIKLGSENRGLAVVSDGGFTSYGDWMPTVSQISFVLPGENKFDNLTNIVGVQGPKLFIHGTEDRQNPFWMGRALFAAASANKTFVEIQGAGHMFSSSHRSENAAVYARVIAELESLVTTGSATGSQ